MANALAGATAAAGADDALALRAVALGYLTPGLSHEAAAERLAVSRATFYRLLHRGIRHLAEQLPRG